MTIPLSDASAYLTASAAAVPGDGHSSLYKTCVTVVAAVLVVLYFDERVRGATTLPRRDPLSAG